MDLNQPIGEYIEEAHGYGIEDPFSDNNFRTLQLLKYFGLQDLPGRQGHDAFEGGFSFELKTTITGKVFSTSQQFNLPRLKAYRETSFWIFGLFQKGSLEPEAIYLVRTKNLEPWFEEQERKLREKIAEGKKPVLNDPRIRLSFIKTIAMEIKNPKPKNMTTMEFISMIFNNKEEIDQDLIELRNKIDEIDKGFITLRNKINSSLEKNKEIEQERFSVFYQNIKAKFCSVLQPTCVEELFNSINIENGDQSEKRSVAAVANSDPVLEASSRISDEDIEAIQREFIEEKVVIETDKTLFVSDNTYTAHFRRWFWQKKGQEPPKRRAPITKKIFKDYGIQRDNEKSRILGISLKDMKKKSVLPVSDNLQM